MTLNPLSRWAARILAVIAIFFILPALFDKIWTRKSEAPLVFFSPVQKAFVYQKSLGGHQFIYADERGREFDRGAFEDLLPFVYFRNYELRNEGPLTLEGRIFDRETIRSQRQSFEIKARDLKGSRPQIALYPLFNNDPGIAMIPFPEDVFRFTEKGMEFINADTNRKDEALSKRFTESLKEKGFTFPATLISGNPTNLKPFDEGYFVKDSQGGVFHIRRVMDQPDIRKTDIPADMGILDIAVSENQRREFYGILITERSGLFLIAWDSYELIPLPSDGFDPRRMDMKLLVNPLYRTLILTGEDRVHATVMDTEYQPLKSFTLPFSQTGSGLAGNVKDFLFPFSLSLESPWQNQASLQLQWGSLWSFGGIVLAMILYLIFFRRKGSFYRNVGEFGFLMLTGLFGLLPLLFVREN